MYCALPLAGRLEADAMRSNGIVFPVELTIHPIFILPGPADVHCLHGDITTARPPEATAPLPRARIVAAAEQRPPEIERDPPRLPRSIVSSILPRPAHGPDPLSETTIVDSVLEAI